MNPYEKDQRVCIAAEHFGAMDVQRRGRVIEVVDAKLIPVQFLKLSPDFRAIRAELEAGREVPGCHLTTREEYVLREIPDA